MRYSFAVFLLVFLFAPLAQAVTSISFTADTVDYDKVGIHAARLHKVDILLDLKAKETITVKADAVEYHDAQFKHANALVDLTANTANINAETVAYNKANFKRANAFVDMKTDTTNIKAEHIQVAQFEARNASLLLDYHAQFTATFASDVKKLADKAWARAKINCNIPNKMVGEIWHCASGQYKAERINVPFSLNLTPQTKGAMVNLTFKEASFSDEAGLHAAEKLTGNVKLTVQKEGDYYRWQNTLNWDNGEMFWQPYYFSGSGHQFVANGTLTDEFATFENAKLNIKDVGALNFNGKLRLKDYALINLDADLPSLDLANAYPLIFKPLLEKTAFNNADIGGKAALKVSMRDAELKTFELKLFDVNIDDKNKKFAFYHINADIPWSYDDAKKVSFAYQSGHLLNLPLGDTKIAALVNRYALTAPTITLPILDGALQLTDVSAAHIANDWYWHLQAKLLPVSMADFSRALNLPVMQGKASAEIPLVTYSGGNLTADGEIVLNVFDGTASVTNLTMKNPLGIAPQLNADIVMRNLDLGSLTRTFSFGAIEGKLDVDVDDLALQNWKTVKFDASVYSSAGSYPKKISQRAVENISALGGAGAAAAIQRSFLQFFKQFNYEKIGLNCKLRNDICEMSGITSTPQGYIIVKGSGIPQITVMGYNQTVGWGELIARVKRVTDGNSKAIVK